MTRYCLLASMGFGLLAASGAGATDVTVSGLFTNKAVVQIDGGPLQTLSVGQKTPQGVVLVSVDRESATFDVDGTAREARAWAARGWRPQLAAGRIGGAHRRRPRAISPPTAR